MLSPMNGVRARGPFRRAVLGGAVTGLIVIAWVVKLLVVDLLSDGRVVDLGLLQLRLGYNSGVAFSIGAGLPDGVVLGVTALVTAVMAGYAWVLAPAAFVARCGGIRRDSRRGDHEPAQPRRRRSGGRLTPLAGSPPSTCRTA